MSKDLVERDPAGALARMAQDTDEHAQRRRAILARGERFLWRVATPAPEHVQVLRVALAPKLVVRSPVPRFREQAAQASKPGLATPELYAAMDRAAARIQAHECMSTYALPSPAAVLRASTQWLLLFARGQADQEGAQDAVLERVATLLSSLLAVETGAAYCCDGARYLFPTSEHAIDWLDATLEDALAQHQQACLHPHQGRVERGGAAARDADDAPQVVESSQGPQDASPDPQWRKPHASDPLTDDGEHVVRVLYLDRVLRESRDEFGRKVMRSFVDVVSHPVSEQDRLRRQQLAALLSSERTGAR